MHPTQKSKKQEKKQPTTKTTTTTTTTTKIKICLTFSRSSFKTQEYLSINASSCET
jgi:hypothetical protein